MDFFGRARAKIAGQEKDRCCENIESVEANDWCNRRQGASAWYESRHAGLIWHSRCRQFRQRFLLFLSPRERYGDVGTDSGES
jgi:hypothetical protein